MNKLVVIFEAGQADKNYIMKHYWNSPFWRPVAQIHAAAGV